MTTLNELLEEVENITEEEKTAAQERLNYIESIHYDLEFDDPMIEEMYKLRTLVSYF